MKYAPQKTKYFNFFLLFDNFKKKKKRKHVVDMVNDTLSLALYRKSSGWPWPIMVNDYPLDRPQKKTYNEKKRLPKVINPHCGFAVHDLSVYAKKYA